MEVAERTNNVYRQSLCFFCQGILAANKSRFLYTYTREFLNVYQFFSTSKDNFQNLWGLYTQNKCSLFQQQTCNITFLSSLISSHILNFCDQANIPQWRAPQAGVKPEKNMENIPCNKVCVCPVILSYSKLRWK